jgi:S1-C subfamily serine protease
MRFTILSFVLFGALFAAEAPSPSTNAEQKEQPIKQVITEPTSDTAKNQRRHILDMMRKGVVIVKVKAFVNATEPETQSWAGTGFIVDKARGLIVTNRHVAGSFSICSYELKFSNGSKTQARRRYVDPFLDFAILEVDSKSIPDDCEELILSDKKLQVNDAVNVMGNAAGDEFSTQEGTIFNTFDSLTAFNDQSFHYSGLTVGGASGSPIFDEKCEVVGIVYGGKFVSGTGLPIAYIKDALSYIQKNQIPPRKGIGARLQYSSLDELATAGFVTDECAKLYRKNFPEAKGKLLTVKHVVSGFKGASVFEPGDILLEINGQPIGPNLIDLSRVIDTSSEPLKLKIFRDDKEKEVSVAPEPLMHGSENKMISFMGTVWFEHHDQLTVSIGKRDSGVYFAGISATSPLRCDDSDFGRWNYGIIYKLIEIDGKPIDSLKTLEAMIPAIEKKSMFTLRYVDFMGQHSGLSAFKQVDRNPREIMIRYEKAFDTPKRYDWDPVNHTWKDTTLGVAK